MEENDKVAPEKKGKKSGKQRLRQPESKPTTATSTFQRVPTPPPPTADDNERRSSRRNPVWFFFEETQKKNKRTGLKFLVAKCCHCSWEYRFSETAKGNLTTMERHLSDMSVHGRRTRDHLRLLQTKKASRQEITEEDRAKARNENHITEVDAENARRLKKGIDVLNNFSSSWTASLSKPISHSVLPKRHHSANFFSIANGPYQLSKAAGIHHPLLLMLSGSSEERKRKVLWRMK
ncbi:hypothetical protein BT69DRAFT_521655 [Atractiella rhizophila]|nr:hypothetical protein BT69DRAFT_521655 [Atractiella rhizophila]